MQQIDLLFCCFKTPIRKIDLEIFILYESSHALSLLNVKFEKMSKGIWLVLQLGYVVATSLQYCALVWCNSMLLSLSRANLGECTCLCHQCVALAWHRSLAIPSPVSVWVLSSIRTNRPLRWTPTKITICRGMALDSWHHFACCL